ncbi:MAG: hypothetical protein LBH18_03340 [Spirochaetaceae bacterium]|jgi:hypothetical protein|nr:hypothetical protein [Spirochaetaceae bacterium]
MNDSDMWEFLKELVDKLPAWFLIALIIVLLISLLVAAAWVLVRLRRDKNGRWYIYSRSYEHQKNRTKQQTALFDKMINGMTDIYDRLKSIELENKKQSFYIDNDEFPKEERIIAGIDYLRSGGNGAAKADIERFIDENPEISKKVLKGFPQWASKQEGKGNG